MRQLHWVILQFIASSLCVANGTRIVRDVNEVSNLVASFQHGMTLDHRESDTLSSYIDYTEIRPLVLSRLLHLSNTLINASEYFDAKAIMILDKVGSNPEVCLAFAILPLTSLVPKPEDHIQSYMSTLKSTLLLRILQSIQVPDDNEFLVRLAHDFMQSQLILHPPPCPMRPDAALLWMSRLADGWERLRSCNAARNFSYINS